MGLDDGLKDLTLSSAADGRLEEQFQERIHEALQTFADAGSYVRGTDGSLVVTIPLEVKLRYDPADRTFAVAARANPIKKPPCVAVVRTAYLRQGSVKVLPEEQLEMDTPNPLRAFEGGSDKEE